MHTKADHWRRSISPWWTRYRHGKTSVEVRRRSECVWRTELSRDGTFHFSSFLLRAIGECPSLADRRQCRSREKFWRVALGLSKWWSWCNKGACQQRWWCRSSTETAVETNQVEIVKYLLEAGANPNLGVFEAQITHNEETLRLLIEASASVPEWSQLLSLHSSIFSDIWKSGAGLLAGLCANCSAFMFRFPTNSAVWLGGAGKWKESWRITPNSKLENQCGKIKKWGNIKIKAPQCGAINYTDLEDFDYEKRILKKRVCENISRISWRPLCCFNIVFEKFMESAKTVENGLVFHSDLNWMFTLVLP